MKQNENTPLTSFQPLRVAVLIDLPRQPTSGGHVKGWEKMAHALAAIPPQEAELDLTLYFSGEESTQELAPHVRIRQLPPVFSTRKLQKILPYVPDHTDLASYHPALAKELASFDLIHTTDGFFCFAQTAEKLSESLRIPLTTSFHTDTVGYARLFTKLTIKKKLGQGWLSRLLIDKWKIPVRQEAQKMACLRKHLSHCQCAFYTRQEDRDLAEDILGVRHVAMMHLGVDRQMVGPHRAARGAVEEAYNIPPNHIVFIFVGRLDEGKNIYTLIEAMEQLIAQNQPVHLITAGLGPAAQDLTQRLGDHVTVAGFVAPDELARLYASVDALALTSKVEIRSMAAVEALTSALPVLAAEESTIPRLFDFTPAMTVVPAGAKAWAKAMADFVHDENKRFHQRKVALAFADTHIADWIDVIQKDFLPHWQRICEETKSRMKNG
ncbi:MAG: glycosyltransferase [Alphaproteobacteria bacterium]|nr:glycosyltransferase [Alphaproteobacteria bacterium]